MRTQNLSKVFCCFLSRLPEPSRRLAVLLPQVLVLTTKAPTRLALRYAFHPSQPLTHPSPCQLLQLSLHCHPPTATILMHHVEASSRAQFHYTQSVGDGACENSATKTQTST
jgi:hypothetical protein